MTSGTVVARVVEALVDRRGAVLAGVSRRAGASVVAESVLASAAILAGIGGTLVDVVFAVRSCESLRTLAKIGVHKIETLSIIRARVGAAVIDLLLTVESSITHRALAEISSLWVVSTVSTIEAGAVGTSHGTQLAVSSVETRRTSAAVGVFKISATSSISARAAGAFVDLNLTAVPGEARSA